MDKQNMIVRCALRMGDEIDNGRGTPGIKQVVVDAVQPAEAALLHCCIMRGMWALRDQTLDGTPEEIHHMANAMEYLTDAAKHLIQAAKNGGVDPYP